MQLRWNLSRDAVEHIAEYGQAGQSIAEEGSAGKWRELRGALASGRELFVAYLGRRLFLLRADAVARAPTLERLAHAATQDDAAASMALKDLLCELDLQDLYHELMQCCRSLPAQRRPPPGEATSGEPPSKLSQLQRSILCYARDCRSPRGAPLDLLRQGHTRAQAAAFSRALARLKTRGLITTTDGPGGRAERIQLTEAGQAAAASRNG